MVERQRNRTHCKKCDKPLDGKHKTYCKACAAEYARKYRATDELREKNNAYQREYHHKNPEKRRRAKVKFLRTKAYGLKPGEWELRYEQQKGCCAICLIPFTEDDGETPRESTKHLRPNIDHDHETGLVRGLLCGKCNKALGLFNDSQFNMSQAITYIRHWNRVHSELKVVS